MSYSVDDDRLVWLHRAERARAIAAQHPDPAACKTMLSVAAAYEEMAKRAVKAIGIRERGSA